MTCGLMASRGTECEVTHWENLQLTLSENGKTKQMLKATVQKNINTT